MLKHLCRHTIRICLNDHRQCCNTDLTKLLPIFGAPARPPFYTPFRTNLCNVQYFHSSASLCKVRKNEKKVKASKEIRETKDDADNPYVQGAMKEMKELESILNEELAKHFSLQVDLRAYEEILVKLDSGEASKEIRETKDDADNPYVQGAMKEMKELESILNEELAKHFSLQVDLRAYEEILVKLDSGEEHRMNRLGRVVLKSPQMVMINFGDNPTAIKAAKLAIQKSNLNVNPQQEGVALYVPVPRMTRERREQLAATAKAKMFNDFKEALNVASRLICLYFTSGTE
ncbi:putative ribosome-recycling factor, mitochondrial [Toxocara canis]|uniref:Ribosome-recycling factor, mitochondrial n=1 Tax=Toxocara canis TaxID=6265 RepID=A0A0B2V3V6_TOXCA|nr:putative ribosome-recycling factor, mitochondrial [Toxocara canis]